MTKPDSLRTPAILESESVTSQFPFLKTFFILLGLITVVNLALFVVGFANAGWEGTQPSPFWWFAGRVAFILLAPYFFFREVIDKIPLLGLYDELIGFIAALIAESFCLTHFIRWMYIRRTRRNANEN